MSETAAFGKYGLIAELGHGGMADVYLAVSRGPAGFSKLVVIKRLRANLVDDPEFRSMLVDEARLAGRLNHPNVVQTNEVAQVGEQFFIAMEYLEGQPLHRILHRSGTKGLPFPMHLRVLADALAGLHHAHELKDYDGTPLEVVHRDATPQNIFVTYEGQVKVVDFGIAKAANRSSETRTGVIKGKIVYMSPEQAMGADVDRRADIFSVGVMLWEAATGQRMWAGLEEFTVMQRLINGEIRPPREINPDISERLDEIVRKAIAYDPSERYATAAEMQKDIEEYINRENLRIGARELGDYVAEMFQDRRAHQRAVIERQLAALKAMNSDQFQAATVPVEFVSGATNLASLTISEPSREVSPVALTPGDLARQAAAGNLTRTGDQLTAMSSVAPKRRGARITGLVATAIVVGTAVVWATSMSKPAASPAPPTTDTPAPPVSAAAPAEPSSITLTLRANPVEAQFRIDNGDPISNPLAGKFPRDNKEHKIEIFAPNYVAKTISVSFSNDRDINESLEKSPTKADNKAPPPAPRHVTRVQPAATAQPSAQPQAPAPAPPPQVDFNNSF